jgi:CubicO group peptidase (beta-lactamase class C family)
LPGCKSFWTEELIFFITAHAYTIKSHATASSELNMQKATFFLWLSVLPLILHAQQQTSGRERFVARLDSFIPQQMQKYGMVGFSLAVVDGDLPVLFRNYGYADLEQKIEASQKSLYPIASITKIFTAMAVMKLQEEGKIDLQAPVESYLHELKLRYAPGLLPITVHDLLTHSSGLVDNIDNGSMCAVPPEPESIIAEANKLYLTIPAGLKRNYSNTGYALLGCLVSKVSGIPYDTYIQQQFLAPMEMSNAGVVKPGDTLPLLSIGYLKDSTVCNETPLRDVAAGGMYSTTADLTQLCSILLQEGMINQRQLLQSATMKWMMTDQTSNLVLRTDDDFGYGLFINNLGSDMDSLIGKNIGHGGDSRVFHSILVVFPVLDIGFILLTNAANGGAFTKAVVLQMAREYIRLVKGIPLQKAIPTAFTDAAVSADKIDHEHIAGTYGSGGEDFVLIRAKNDRKLIFRQEKIKLLLKRDEQNLYNVKFLLLKIFPIKIKTASFAFREINGDVFMKTIDNSSKQFEYVSMKDKGIPVTASWRSRTGAYKIINLCEGNLLLFPDELQIIGNKILLHRSDPLREEEDFVSFNVISDTMAIGDGIERGSGSTLEILPNGNLYWSGFEMTKVE